MTRRRKKIIGIALATVCCWLACVAGSIVIFGSRDHSTKADCIIVLGAAIYGDKPSPVFEERIHHGIHLYQSGIASTVIFTGGFGDGATLSESSVARNYAIAAGIPANAILIESTSRTTQQNIGEAQKLMAAHNLKSAIIVSDPYHMRRSCRMAEDIGITTYSSPTPTTRYRSLKPKFQFLLREIYFTHYYWFTGR